MASGKMVRVVLKPDGVSEDEGNARQMVLDMIVDEATQVSTGPFPAFGRSGDYRKPETLYSFTVMMDGRLDMGAYATDEQRQDVLAIRTAKLEAGTLVPCAGPSGDLNYAIVSVTPLIKD